MNNLIELLYIYFTEGYNKAITKYVYANKYPNMYRYDLEDDMYSFFEKYKVEQ